MSKPRRRTILLLASMLPALWAAPDIHAQSAAEAPAEVRLEPGDAVRLLIKDEPDLSGEFPVLPDGAVLLPLVGLIPVAGREFDEVVEHVRGAYAEELVDRMVLLQPLVRVRVLGEVRQPGLYLVDATFDLGDVLARAGGMLPTAAAKKVTLVRDGRAERFDMRNGMSPAGPLLPADEVVVPKRSWLSESTPILIGAGTSVLAAAITALLVR